jgi:trk system potassium uptake protein TrkH
MINFRIVARVFSLLLIIEGLFMILSAGISFLYHEHAVSSFIYSALITIATGTIVFSPLRNVERVSGRKEGYIIVTGTWLIFALFGAMPYLFSHSVGNFSDAFFESMSGFSTTGATIFSNIESLPHGILFWRSLTQWLGGLGIIFISLSIFPIVRSINIQIAATEFSGHQIEKIHPRFKEAAGRLFLIYFIITAAEAILLTAGGMPLFDAICHSFSTMSTGGFSTRNNGIAAFASPYLMAVITVFMFLAGTNLALVYFSLKGKFRKATGNNEFVFYTVICIVFILLGAGILFSKEDLSAGKALSTGAFHVVSIITTTGFYTQDYNLWGYSMILVIFILMLTGGTAGSTSGGIKIVRLLLVTKNTRQELIKLIHPSAFLPVRLDRHIVPQSIIYNVLVFLTLYFFIICFSTFVISAMGYDFTTSFSTSASMLANIGPSIGTFGPFSNYSALPVAGKWFLSVLMLLGRLELLTVMILFTRSFYRN